MLPGATKGCPDLCGPDYNTKVDTCEIVTAPRPQPTWPPATESDRGCPTKEPADLSSCSSEGMRCSWSRESTSVCKQTAGTCKMGVWRLTWCGAAVGTKLVADPSVCPTRVYPFTGALPSCRPGVEQTCTWKTGDEVCSDVEALCYDGQWKNMLCVREGKAVAVHCTGTFTPSIE